MKTDIVMFSSGILKVSQPLPFQPQKISLLSPSDETDRYILYSCLSPYSQRGCSSSDMLYSLKRAWVIILSFSCESLCEIFSNLSNCSFNKSSHLLHEALRAVCHFIFIDCVPKKMFFLFSLVIIETRYKTSVNLVRFYICKIDICCWPLYLYFPP